MASFRLSTMLFALASGTMLVSAWRAASPIPNFLVPAPAGQCSESPEWQEHLLPQPSGDLEVHSATMAVLPNGDRIAVWYAGSGEAEPDVALFQSIYRNGRWHAPEAIVTPEKVGAAEGRYTKRIGNPAMFRDATGKLRLFFVSVSFGGWAGSSINQIVSADDGVTWQPPVKVITSPFLNLSTLVRHPPIPLADGGFCLPAYHEMIRKMPEMLQFDCDGRLVRKVRMSCEPGSLQPVLVPIAGDQAFSYLRDRCFFDGKVLWQETRDGGRTWTRPAPLDLPNPDAPVAAGRLADGTFLLVYNPTGDGRGKLALAASRDGKKWRDLTMLDEGATTAEFSYPTLVIDGDRIDITYTWQRKTIKHIRCNSAWIKERFDG